MSYIDAVLPSGLGTLTLGLYDPSDLTAEPTATASEGSMSGHYRWTVSSAAGVWLATVKLSDGTLLAPGAVRIGSGSGPFYLTDPASLTDDATEAETIASEVWSHATRTLTITTADLAASLDDGVITIRRGDSTTLEFSGFGDLSDAEEVWLTIKSYRSDEDEDAIVQVSMTGGLLYLNGEQGEAGLGTLTIDDDEAGDVTVELDEAATAELAPATKLVYDVQVLRSGGTVTTLADGCASVVGDVTRAVA